MSDFKNTGTFKYRPFEKANSFVRSEYASTDIAKSFLVVLDVNHNQNLYFVKINLLIIAFTIYHYYYL